MYFRISYMAFRMRYGMMIGFRRSFCWTRGWDEWIRPGIVFLRCDGGGQDTVGHCVWGPFSRCTCMTRCGSMNFIPFYSLLYARGVLTPDHIICNMISYQKHHALSCRPRKQKGTAALSSAPSWLTSLVQIERARKLAWRTALHTYCDILATTHSSLIISPPSIRLASSPS